MTRVAVTGATGRMGQEVITLARDRDDVDLAFAVSRDPEDVATDVTLESDGDLPALLAEHQPDVLVDFTVPEASVEYVRACAKAGVAVVVGTTGFADEQNAALDAASETIPLLESSNFARGIQALLNVVEEAVAALPDYDIELVETHHNGKRDAPSGTANMILDRIDEQRSLERVYGREGDAPRAADEVGVLVRRAGNIRGEHEVLLAGNDEVVTLTHRAESRGVFAAGALDAAVWVATRDAGRYDFANVIDDSQ
ncbi:MULTISPECIES: 4-hydroxy-tetrahydrodipicolinate reductase [unclassified Haladaptatus]|uniref:4-hydroxy-tetrahydrodipicolinate reductase n=1 Tax=unclassified Haladaptatus TaxID=2622732 RepID=UPI0023E84CF2|nr:MULTISPECIES: 4-hydroxy-tetrahydrodipicolinate reductase [unclassified Haladaptatus]